MPEFVTKTIQLRECRRCKNVWAAEDVTLEVEDRIEIVRIMIAHCPACSEGFSKEINRPGYRRTGKRIR